MEKIKKNKYSILLFVFFVICIYLIGNAYMPAPDEYNYSHITWTDQRLTGIKDILTSQKILYENWTGRIPVHTLIQSILYVGRWIYDLINPIIFVLYIILLGKIVNEKSSYFKISLALFLILFFVHGSGDKFIWLSGSINYLWTTTIMLGVMYYYYKILIKDEKLTKNKIPLFLLLSFFAGWSQENVSFVLGSFIILIGLMNIKKFLAFPKKEKIVLISSVLLFGIGAMLLIFAPGNLKRAAAGTMGFQIGNLLSNGKHMIGLIIIYIISGILMLVIKQRNKEKVTKKIMIKTQVIFALSIGIGILPMLIITEFPLRATLPYETVLLVGILANAEWIVKNLNLKKTLIVLEIIFTIGVCHKLLKNVAVAQNYMLPYKEKIQMEIYQAQKENKKDVQLSAFEYVDEINILGQGSLLVDFSPKEDKNNLINTYMATYYGFDSIEAVSNKEE